MSKKEVKVVQAEGQPEVVAEITAQAIVDISQGLKKLKSGKLNEKAIILLITNACKPKVSPKAVRTVLEAIESLETEYIR